MDEKLAKHDFPGKRGHWTQDEHERFIEAINKYGKDWKKIMQVVGTRSSNQIRSHAQKYFIKLVLQQNKIMINLTCFSFFNQAISLFNKVSVLDI